MLEDTVSEISLSLPEFNFFRGRVGLYATLRALGIGSGDFVAVQAFTCVAIPEAILACGARPLWIDIEPNGVNMSAVDLALKLNENVKAVVVQHTFGIPANMEGVVRAAGGRPLIEDCCHTWNSKYNGKKVGTFGIASFYSYEWGKPIVGGIGGGVILNDRSLRAQIEVQVSSLSAVEPLLKWRLAGQYLLYCLLYRPSWYWPVRSAFRAFSTLGLAQGNYNPVVPGTVSRDFTLKIPAGSLKRAQKNISKYNEYASYAAEVSRTYSEAISSNHNMRPPKVPEGSDVAYLRYPLLVKDKPAVLQKARENNIELAEWYSSPVHPLKGKELEKVGYIAGTCQEAELRAAEIVTLPVNIKVSKPYCEKVVSFLKSLG